MEMYFLIRAQYIACFLFVLYGPQFNYHELILFVNIFIYYVQYVEGSNILASSFIFNSNPVAMGAIMNRNTILGYNNNF